MKWVKSFTHADKDYTFTILTDSAGKVLLADLDVEDEPVTTDYIYIQDKRVLWTAAQNAAFPAAHWSTGQVNGNAPPWNSSQQSIVDPFTDQDNNVGRAFVLGQVYLETQPDADRCWLSIP